AVRRPRRTRHRGPRRRRSSFHEGLTRINSIAGHGTTLHIDAIRPMEARMKPSTALALLALTAMPVAIAQSGERTGEQIVKQQCASCHEKGLHGAPRIDDRAVWAPRMKAGLDAMVRSATAGHGKMPARGGLANTTDGELRSAIAYMFNPAGIPPK